MSRKALENKITKISGCRVNTTSRRRIKQLGIFLVLFFFYFPMKVARGHNHSSRGKSRHLMTALCQGIVCDINPALCRYLCICCRGCCLNSLITERSHSFSVLNRPYFDIPISHVVIHFHLV